jgi:hypothetical protein
MGERGDYTLVRKLISTNLCTHFILVFIYEIIVCIQPLLLNIIYFPYKISQNCEKYKYYIHYYYDYNITD